MSLNRLDPGVGRNRNLLSNYFYFSDSQYLTIFINSDLQSRNILYQPERESDQQLLHHSVDHALDWLRRFVLANPNDGFHIRKKLDEARFDGLYTVDMCKYLYNSCRYWMRELREREERERIVRGGAPLPITRPFLDSPDPMEIETNSHDPMEIETNSAGSLCRREPSKPLFIRSASSNSDSDMIVSSSPSSYQASQLGSSPTSNMSIYSDSSTTDGSFRAGLTTDPDNSSSLFSHDYPFSRPSSRTPNSSPQKQRCSIHRNRRWSTPPREYTNFPAPLSYTEDDVDLTNIYVVPKTDKSPTFTSGIKVSSDLINKMEHRYRGHPFVSVKTNLGLKTLSLCEVMTTLGIRY